MTMIAATLPRSLGENNPNVGTKALFDGVPQVCVALYSVDLTACRGRLSDRIGILGFPFISWKRMSSRLFGLAGDQPPTSRKRSPSPALFAASSSQLPTKQTRRPSHSAQQRIDLSGTTDNTQDGGQAQTTQSHSSHLKHADYLILALHDLGATLLPSQNEVPSPSRASEEETDSPHLQRDSRSSHSRPQTAVAQASRCRSKRRVEHFLIFLLTSEQASRPPSRSS